jgi:hypothetical protein
VRQITNRALGRGGAQAGATVDSAYALARVHATPLGCRIPFRSAPVRNGAILLCFLLLACAKAAPPRTVAGDTLTRRQKDSVLGASRLPGAKGIRGALTAQDSAAARNARLDSIQ